MSPRQPNSIPKSRPASREIRMCTCKHSSALHGEVYDEVVGRIVHGRCYGVDRDGRPCECPKFTEAR